MTDQDGIVEFTTISPRWYERKPYAGHTARDVFNDGDSIFDEARLLDLSKDGDAYAAAISFDVAGT